MQHKINPLSYRLAAAIARKARVDIYARQGRRELVRGKVNREMILLGRLLVEAEETRAHEADATARTEAENTEKETP
uniref:Uncharacterized protein n=1 Tax=Mycena chlorophos TaxID=658473 RepID=A0ABQ0MBE6_MYCCL|nr:predicted protein [Mycena chlorophos]